MMNYDILFLHLDHYKKWLNLYYKYAEYYQVEVPENNFNLTWEWLNDKNHPLRGVVASFENSLIGFAHFRSMPSPLDSCNIGFLDDLYVLPEYRGNKIGRSLIEKVKKEGEKQGWPYINWITKDDNYSARSLYDKIANKTDWNYYELIVKE